MAELPLEGAIRFEKAMREPIPVRATGLDGRFALGGKSYRCHQFLNWWLPNATGIWHLNGFES